MMRSGLLKQKEHMEFLKTVPSFSKLNDEIILKIANVLEEVRWCMLAFLLAILKLAIITGFFTNA